MELEKSVQLLMQEMVYHSLTISLDEDSAGNYTKEQFQNKLLLTIGPSYTYYINQRWNHTFLSILNIEKKEELLYITGKIAGDTYMGIGLFFVPQLFFYKNIAYYKAKKIGTVYSEEQYQFDQEGILYVITERGLTKYDPQANVVWHVELTDRLLDNRLIKRQNVRNLKFYPYSRPNDSFPIGLLAIQDLFTIEYYDKQTGILYARGKIEQS